jgi:PAS domain S-box-containing protein
MADRIFPTQYRRWCLEIGIVALIYFGAARLGLLMAFSHKNVSPVWPPSGFALAALLVRGTRLWPAITLGAFLANYLTGLAAPTALAIGIGNTLEAVMGAYLLRRLQCQPREGRLRDMLGLILLGGIVSPTAAATIGVASLWIGGYIGRSAWIASWGTWWLGDGMGILVVTPILLAWTVPLASLRAWADSARIWKILEAGAFMLALIGITRYIFDGGKEYPYAVFPCLIWAAMRFGPRGATSAILVVSGLAVWGTLHGLGPFVTGTDEQNLEFLQTFMGVVTITTLVMAAAMTEREYAQQTQAQLLAEVQHQRERLDGIVATVPTIVWEANGQPDSATQRIDFISEFVQMVLGYSVEEWLSEPNFWLKIVHPEDREKAARVAAEAYESGLPHENQFRWIAKDGRIVWTESHSVTLHDAQRHPIGMRGVNIDITDRKQAEEERERLLQELQRHQQEIEALNGRLRRAMAETHHRVKNNLQVICALIELQGQNEEEPVAVSELRRLSRHVQSLAVIHDLLTREVKTNGDADHIRLQAAMQELMPLLQGTAGERRLRFTVEDTRVSIGQATALAVLVNELVSNALKHGAGDIDLSLTVLEPTALLEVCDSGPGFPSEFNPRSHSRTGLELIYSLSTLDLGGEVAFENRPTGGARVRVTFPIRRATGKNGSVPEVAA